MNATLSRLARDVASLRAQVAPPSAPMTALEVARRGGIDPDPWQARFLESRGNALLCCGRQTGKSTATAVRAIHQAVSFPGTVTLITAPTLRQSQLLYAKVRAFHAALGPLVPQMVEESALRFTLSNGSQVVAVPGDGRGIRGYTAHLLLIDEAALTHDDTFAAVAPMVATTNGPIVALSTPHGKRGFFHGLWESDDPAWTRTMVTSPESPRISAAWLAEQQRILPSYQYRQEHLCEFVQTNDAYFDAESIARAFVSGPTLFPIESEDTVDVA
jgi:hypothetical protein